MNEFVPSTKLEQTIRLAVDVPEAEELFLKELGDRLEEAARGRTKSPKPDKPRLRLFPQPAWQVGFAFALVIILVVLALGPQQVLAQVQRLLGYIPGIGFVDMNQPLVLSQPVSLQHDGITVQISQVIASPEGTLIQYSITYPEGKQPEDWPLDPKLELQPRLLLPDGQEIKGQGWSSGSEGSSFQFSALPLATRQVTLILNCLPIISMKGTNCLAGEWRFGLQLVPVSADQFPGILTQPYAPDASTAANGISMRVQQVAHNREITAVQLQFAWDNSLWRWMGSGGSPDNVQFRDDNGYRYTMQGEQPVEMTSLGFPVVQAVPPRSPQDTPTGQTVTQVETYSFAPLSNAAQQLSLSIDSLRFEVPASGQFSLDLGPDPQIGQTWTLDQRFDVAGFEVRLVGARLRETMEPDGPGGQERFYWLDFYFRAESQPERQLDYFQAEQVNEQPASTARKGFAGGGAQGIVLSFGTQYLPHGRQEYQINRAYLNLHGPWQVEWAIPDAIRLPATERVAQPQEAEQAQNGVLLKVDRVQASNRASQAQVTAPEVPPDQRLLYALGWNPLTQSEPAQADLYLQDESGQRYEATKAMYLASPWEGYDPAQLTFAPVPPDRNQLTLHVPAVELKQPGQAVLSVEVPSGLAFHEQQWTEMVGPVGKQVPFTKQQTVSDTWPLDLTLELAGYEVHFGQAYLQQGDLLAPGAYQLVLTGAPLVESQAERWLRSIQVKAIQRPDGSTWQAKQPGWLSYYSFSPQVTITPAKTGSGELMAELRLNVTNENGVDLLAGNYTIDLEGATVIVPGPWDLGFAFPDELPVKADFLYTEPTDSPIPGW